jgi:hypothetical protein
MEQLGFVWSDFHEILFFKNLRKSVNKILFSLKTDKITGTLHEQKYKLLSYLTQFSRIKNVSDKRSTGKSEQNLAL